jgi:Fe-S-cluster containining protein
MDQGDATVPLEVKYVALVGEATRRTLGDGRSLGKVEGLVVLAADYADREIGAWAARPDAPSGIACRAGCSACCHGPIGVTVPEVIRVGRVLLDEATDADGLAVLDRARKAEAARVGRVGRDRERLRHPCPLLDEAGSCSIYEDRPLNCRSWSSFDASACNAYFDDPAWNSTIPVDAVRRTIGTAIADGMRGGLANLGMEHAHVELAVALRIFLEDPTAADRWLDGERAFAAAEMAAPGG